MTAKKKPKPKNRLDTSELEKKLSPERLRLFKKIEKLRKSIGPVSTNVSDLVGEMRGDDD